MARRMTLVVALLFAVASCGDDDPVTDTSAADDGASRAATTDGADTDPAATSTAPTTAEPFSTDEADASGTTTAPPDPAEGDGTATEDVVTTLPPATSEPSSASSPDTTAAPTTVPPTTAPPTVPPTTVPPTTVPPTTVPAPAFVSSVRSVTEAELGSSWRAGCPVEVADLRWLEVSHWNYNGEVATGVLVVHTDHAGNVALAFKRIYDARFPIQSMLPITDFNSSDDASMAANNTSAFNCREISGRPGVWSQHAYGGAVDINPLVNPWVQGGVVDPPGGAPYVDRSADVQGLIRSGDAVTAAFAEIGWGWGGNWSSSLDYQHFSHNGR